MRRLRAEARALAVPVPGPSGPASWRGRAASLVVPELTGHAGVRYGGGMDTAERSNVVDSMRARAAETWRVACLWARIGWYYLVVRTWRDLPGPWPVRVALVAACLAVPGPVDELALIILARACRAWRAARKEYGNAKHK